MRFMLAIVQYSSLTFSVGNPSLKDFKGFFNRYCSFIVDRSGLDLHPRDPSTTSD